MDKVAAQMKSETGRERILVAYFSWSGNTREVAKQIHKIVGGDLFEIVSVDKYPSEYDECVEQARRELDKGYRPRLKSEVEDLGSYNMVYVGYPNWWSTIPRPVASFVSMCDSSSVIIAPFCTHGGGGLGRSVEDIKRLCPRSTVLEALAVSEGDVRNAHKRVSDWVRRTGMME